MKRYLVTLCVMIGLCLPALMPSAAVATTVRHPTAKHKTNPETVVTEYFGILNDGMRSGDFSALTTVYAPDATLTQSSPAGVTKVFMGIVQITSFYQATYLKLKGFQWTQDAMRRLSSSVVVSYEHAGSPPQAVPGRCEHLFVVRGNKIQSLDWTTFYAGQP